MELVETLEINGEEREIADAYAREQIATNAEGIAGLNNNLAQLDINQVDLKMLGWTVPKECPIQNYVDSDGVFHQRVERVDLGDLEWGDSQNGFFYSEPISNAKTPETNWSIMPNYSNKYECVAFQAVYNNSVDDAFAIHSERTIWLRDTTYTDTTTFKNAMKGVYLYYELSTEITTNVDGNEAVTKVNDSLGYYGMNYCTPIWTRSDDNRIITKVNCSANDLITFIFGFDISPYSIIYAFYDESGTIIGGDVTIREKQKSIKAPTNTSYIRFLVYKGGDGFESNISQSKYKFSVYINNAVDVLKSDLSDCCKKSDITTNETLIGTFNGKNYYRKLFTGISGSGGSVTVNVGGKIEIYNYYGRAYTYGQSGASDVKYPIPNKNYYIDSQNASETSFQLTIPTSSDTRKVDLVIEYTKVDE